jgi:RsmE family RNA methyltransferase
MKIEAPVSFEQLLTDSVPLFWLDESLALDGKSDAHFAQVLSQYRATAPSSPETRALLVGPEGGLSPTERGRLLQLTVTGKKAITRVHLGSMILRAETAALTGVSMMVGDHYGKN